METVQLNVTVSKRQRARLNKMAKEKKVPNGKIVGKLIDELYGRQK